MNKIVDWDKKRFSINEVASKLHVSLGSVYRWVHRGVRGKRLAVHWIGGRQFVFEDDLNAFLNRDSEHLNVEPERNRRAQSRLESYGFDINRRQSPGRKE